MHTVVDALAYSDSINLDDLATKSLMVMTHDANSMHRVRIMVLMTNTHYTTFATRDCRCVATAADVDT